MSSRFFLSFFPFFFYYLQCSAVPRVLRLRLRCCCCMNAKRPRPDKPVIRFNEPINTSHGAAAAAAAVVGALQPRPSLVFLLRPLYSSQLFCLSLLLLLLLRDDAVSSFVRDPHGHDRPSGQTPYTIRCMRTMELEIYLLFQRAARKVFSLLQNWN